MTTRWQPCNHSCDVGDLMVKEPQRSHFSDCPVWHHMYHNSIPAKVESIGA